MIKESRDGGAGECLVLSKQLSLASVASSVSQTWPEMGGVYLYGDFRTPIMGISCAPTTGKVMWSNGEDWAKSYWA